MALDWNSLGSTLFGGALCLALARAYIAKMIKTVETLDETVQHLTNTISVLGVRVDEIGHLKKTVQTHDRQIATLEAIVRSSPRYCTSKD
jgi:hypothetical protein